MLIRGVSFAVLAFIKRSTGDKENDLAHYVKIAGLVFLCLDVVIKLHISRIRFVSLYQIFRFFDNPTERPKRSCRQTWLLVDSSVHPLHCPATCTFAILPALRFDFKHRSMHTHIYVFFTVFPPSDFKQADSLRPALFLSVRPFDHAGNE